jgi:hypothetical protein
MRYNEIDTSPPGYFYGIELASLRQRWEAGAIDYLLVPAFWVVGLGVFVHSFLAGWLVAFAFLIFDIVLLQGAFGQSVGKYLRGLTTFVVKTELMGSSTFLDYPGWRRCGARLGFFLLYDIWIYGLFRPAVEPWGRCFSDSRTDTFVAIVGRPRQLKFESRYGEVKEFPKWGKI